MAEFSNKYRPCPIAHRGCMEAGPENSLTAFKEAAALGAGGVEMDVRRTRDGKLVVFHDADVRRLTMGWNGPYSSGKVKDMTWEKLSQERLPFGGHLLKQFPEGGLNAGTFGSEEVEYLHQRGILVFSNLGDTPDWWESLDRLGVDGFKTNCLGQYRKWRQKWEGQ